MFNLSWQSVRDAIDYATLKNIPKLKLAPVFAAILLRKADNAFAGGKEIKNVKRDYNLPQSAVSAVFFNVFLGMGDSALHTVAPNLDENDP